VALQHNLLGLVPVAILHGRLQICAMVAIKVLEYAILVLQASIASLLGRSLLYGCVAAGVKGGGAGRCEAGVDGG